MFTKGEWAIDGGTNKKGDLFIWKAGEYYGGHAIATVHGQIQEKAKANAERIVKCVNSHDELLEAGNELRTALLLVLKNVKGTIDIGPILAQSVLLAQQNWDEAIAKAE